MVLAPLKRHCMLTFGILTSDGLLQHVQQYGLVSNFRRCPEPKECHILVIVGQLCYHNVSNTVSPRTSSCVNVK